jgi:hypothetical protein
MTQYPFKSKKSFEELRTNSQQYLGLISKLQEMYQDNYFITSIKLFKTKENNYITTSTLTNFLPTILPIADYVVIIIFMGNTILKYIIEFDKLVKLLGNKANLKEIPIKHLIIEGIIEDEEKNKILHQTTQVKNDLQLIN